MGAEPGRAAGAVVAGRYRIVRPLKAGGMGAVHEVVDLTTDRRRALKLLLPDAALDADLVARFRREATVAGRVESEHVVEVFDAGVDDDGAAFLVMELLRGEDLGALSRRRGPLPAAEVIVYLSQAALGLERTHAERIVHRDLKPENLFVTERDDGSPCVKILDFGIAKALADVSGAVGTTRNLGTPLYMAPEQLRGDGGVEPAGDLYALAQIAYALLSGSAYFAEELRRAPNLFAFLAKVAAGPSEPPSERAGRGGVSLPASFDAWFEHASAPDPAERFGSATEQVRELAAALGVPAPASTGKARSAPSVALVVDGGAAAGDVLDRAREPSTTVVVASAARASPIAPRTMVLGLAAVATVAVAILAVTATRGTPDDAGTRAAAPAPPEPSAATLPATAGAAPVSATATSSPAPAADSALAAPVQSASAASSARARPTRPPAAPSAPRTTPSAAPPAAPRPTHDPLDEL